MILYHAADLLWSTRIKAAAKDLGLSARPVRTIEMLDARLADSSPTGLVLDLETGETGLQLLMHLRGWEANRAQTTCTPLESRQRDADEPAIGDPQSIPHCLRVIAFGPHVAKDLLSRARDAGADEVLTRGAFDHRLADVLRWAGGAG